MKTAYNQTFSYKTKAEICDGITGRRRCDACLLGMLLFANTLKNNGFDNMTEERILTEAEAADLISNAWIVDNENLTSLNVLMIIRNLAMMILKDTKK